MTAPRLTVLPLLVVVAAANAQAPFQTLLDLAPAADGHTYNLSPGMAFGTAATLNIGKVANSPLELYRGYFRFDLSAIPAGAEVAHAELHWFQTNSSGGGLPVNIHPVSATWDEATLTWSTNPAFGAKYSEVEIGGTSGWQVWDLTCLVRNWRGGVTPNFGIVVKDDETASGASRPGFGVSREGAMAMRPFLRVLANTSYGAALGAPRGSRERGDVPLTFRLVDPSAATSNAMVSHSTDGGVTFAPSTVTGAIGLAGTGIGLLATVVWQSAADGIGTGGVAAVQVRVDVSNGIANDSLTFAFEVDNSPPCAGCTVRVPPAADVTLTNQLECEPAGQSHELVLGRVQGGSFPIYNRTLFRFDVSHLAPGTPILGATFHYWQYDGGGAGCVTAYLHRVTAAWNEGTALWATTPASNPTSDSMGCVGDVFDNGTFQLFDCTALVQDWVDGVLAANGFVILGDEFTAGASRASFGYSREHAVAAQQPFLEIMVGTPPIVCTISAPLGGTLGGDVTVDYLAIHPASATVSIQPRWSSDGGATWSVASSGGGSGTSGLSSSPAGVPHNFVWDSTTDLTTGTPPTAVLFELTISDGAASSRCDTMFTIDNSAGCTTLCGDCNDSGTGPDILDALTAAQVAAGLIVPSVTQTYCCDVNASGTVSIIDALAIAQNAAGLGVVLMCL